MKMLMEEYGGMVMVAIAVIVALMLVFVRYDFLGVVGAVADVNSEITYSQGESALNDVVNNRSNPVAELANVDSHVYQNQAFRPLTGVEFTDSKGQKIDAVVTSIVLHSSDGREVELIDYFNATENVIVLNPDHYSDEHQMCLEDEFEEDYEARLIIDADDVMNCSGIAVVTYKATDAENQVTVLQLTFVIDSKTI